MARYPFAVDDLALIRTSRLYLFTPSASSPSTTMLKFKPMINQPSAVKVSPSELVHLPSCGICFTTAVPSKALTPSYHGRRISSESSQFQPACFTNPENLRQKSPLLNMAINRCAPESRMSSHALPIHQVDSLSRRAIASLSPDQIGTPSTVLSINLQQPAKPISSKTALSFEYETPYCCWVELHRFNLHHGRVKFE